MTSNGNGASAPVSVVVIGAENLDASLEFYSGTLGLEVAETWIWQGPEFERYWHVPEGTTARCALLEHGADPVGRIQLMEFDAPNHDRKLVRPSEIHRATGLFNLNIYSSDIDRDCEQLKSQGFNFWAEPLRTDFGPAVGEIVEVAFDGPDGVVINLVQLLTEDPKTLSGSILHFIEGYGRTRTGFTSVATTSHGVIDMEKARAFYMGPLHMTLFMETVLEGAETNRTMDLAEDARTQSVFVQGDHEYGKIALSAPMNYEIPNLVPDAVPPNIGYLAQSFQVDDLDEAASACAATGVEEFSAPVETDLPGRGKCKTMLVRNPGSGALQELFQII
ncbi:MAG: VOC family protein [Gammaproteobacteria bacterium]|jgi:catechol 2,3-dioxygenase-like lactoylglutathione lyase family enzyme|nr:VOC family protein [Gammaproteobacteria bacterium]MDP6615632.1 VOC family protein [Gammaproteobacteria bacterium]MDP6696079.1 VOC family protein [Gammaproteobacteria bacterium]